MRKAFGYLLKFWEGESPIPNNVNEDTPETTSIRINDLSTIESGSESESENTNENMSIVKTVIEQYEACDSDTQKQNIFGGESESESEVEVNIKTETETEKESDVYTESESEVVYVNANGDVEAIKYNNLNNINDTECVEINTEDDLYNLTNGSDFCIHEGVLYGIYDDELIEVADLMVYDEDENTWSPFEGNTIDMINHLGLSHEMFEFKNIDHSDENEEEESDSSDVIINENDVIELKEHHENVKEMYQPLDSSYESIDNEQLIVPLLSDFDRDGDCESDNNDENENFEWTENKLFEGIPTDEYNYYYKQQCEEYYKWKTEIDELLEVLAVEENDNSTDVDDNDDVDLDVSIDTSSEDQYYEKIGEDIEEDISSFSYDEDDIDECEVEVEVDEDEVEVEDEVDVDVDDVLDELYDRWCANDYKNDLEKFGFEYTKNPSLGELFMMYNDNIEELNSLPTLFYHDTIVNDIREEIETTYNELIIDFLIEVFVNCEYRYRDNDGMICNELNIELFPLEDFINKYIDVIDRNKYANDIINGVTGSHRLPHIATVYYAYNSGCEGVSNKLKME